MLFQELHDYYGTWTQLSRELGLGTTTYQNWVKKGYIPFNTQLLIEKRSKRKFKADLTHGKPKNG